MKQISYQFKECQLQLVIKNSRNKEEKE